MVKRNWVFRYLRTYLGLFISLIWILQVKGQNKPTNSVKRIENGILLSFSQPKLNTSHVKFLRLQFINSKIVRVTTSPQNSIDSRPTLMAIGAISSVVPVHLSSVEKHHVLVSTQDLQIDVDELSGELQFKDLNGRLLLKGGKESFRPAHLKNLPKTDNATNYYAVSQEFENDHQDDIYGLGGNQLGLTNIKGKDIDLIQYNSNVFIPFVVTSGGYGLLWDNNSITHFGDNIPFKSLSTLNLSNKNGQKGSLTASYQSDSSETPLIRNEKGIDYEFAGDSLHLPSGFVFSSKSRISWQGSISPIHSGMQRFRMKFGGYIKLWINGELLIDRWRQCWNPAEQIFEYPMVEGKKYAIKVEWRPDGTNSFASMQWKNPLKPDQKNKIAFHSEAASQIDYYFISGKNMDSLVAGYRAITGKANILPKWAYGFWQSKEHYNSSKEILQVAREFRQRQIPIDNIVQDWYYWKKDQWGTQQFDSSRYPDPKAMIDSLHQKYQLHFMISVWPKFYEGTPVFKNFWDSGWLYKKNILDKRKDWVGYVSTFYDAFNPRAATAFWHLVNNRLFQKGIDAWWLDATEPDIVDNIPNQMRMDLMTPTDKGAPEINFNAYALANEKAFYEGQRKVAPDKRVFILTRSAYGGSQRYSAATWSGDIGSTWQDMKNQIATGISFSISGVPNWSMDIGGFATPSEFQHPDASQLDEWRELNTRWFQFGAFCPIFRSHGQAPAREIYHIAPKDHPAYQSMLYYDKLRYRLMPYIYSIAGATYWKDYTIMRGLFMDFQNDSMARQIKDEYVFGPSLLVSPVYTYQAREKTVYLPTCAGWYDLYTGSYFKSGQSIQANAPYQRMPVFVKAGSIIPIGPELQFTGEKKADSITLYIYTGADAHFTLYEDADTNYDYEKGRYSTIGINYNQTEKTLTINNRQGDFEGQLKNRLFLIKWISPERPIQLDLDKNQKDNDWISYSGQRMQIKMPYTK